MSYCQPLGYVNYLNSPLPLLKLCCPPGGANSSFRTPSMSSVGPATSVGTATDYGLDGPGSNPGGDEIFRSSRPALGPTQPPVKRVPGLSRGQSAAGACC